MQPKADPKQQWLALGDRCLGDTLDALVKAIADALPDQPWERLNGQLTLTLPHSKTDLGDLRATITCFCGSKQDVRWALELFGPPSCALPGHSISWHYGA
jgi:hypothetical protein